MSLHLLGASTPEQHQATLATASGQRAKTSGQRAVAAGQKIAKRAPRLSKAVVAAGQRAIAAGSKATGPASKTKTAASPAGKGALSPGALASANNGNLAAGPGGKLLANTANLNRGPLGPLAQISDAVNSLRSTRTAPGPQMAPARGAGPQLTINRPASGPTQGPARGPVPGPQLAAGGRGGILGPKAHIGDDPPPDPNAETDIYSALADAATQAADFIGTIQDLIAEIPPDSQLAAKGQNIIDNFQILLGGSIENALSGNVGQYTQGLVDLLTGSNGILTAQRDRTPPEGVWAWVAAANAYLTAHPAPDSNTNNNDPNAAPTAGAPGTATAVAHLTISPQSTTITAGTPLQFSIQATDKTGAAVTPQATTWTVTGTPIPPQYVPGQVPPPQPVPPTIDQSGNLTAQSPGNYTVTAKGDAITATAYLTAQADPYAQAPPPDSGALPPPPSGGYGGGGGYDDGSGYGEGLYADDGGGYGPDFDPRLQPGYTDPFASDYSTGDPYDAGAARGYSDRGRGGDVWDGVPADADPFSDAQAEYWTDDDPMIEDGGGDGDAVLGIAWDKVDTGLTIANPAYGLYRLFGGKGPTSGNPDQGMSTDTVRDIKGTAAYKAMLARGVDADARGEAADKANADALAALSALRAAPSGAAEPIAVNVPSFALGGGGHGGGHHHHGGRRHHGGGGDWGGGPGVAFVETVDPDDFTVEEIADLVARRLKAGSLEMLGARHVTLGADDLIQTAHDATRPYHQTFAVDTKTRTDDAQGNGIYLLHGKGDASAFVPGLFVYTPDGITWDIVSVDADKKGLTVSKKRDDVSFAAWLTGDWSTLTGDVATVMTKTPAATAAEATEAAAKKAADATGKYLPWLIGGVIVLGVGSVAVPLVVPLLAAGAGRKVLP